MNERLRIFMSLNKRHQMPYSNLEQLKMLLLRHERLCDLSTGQLKITQHFITLSQQ